MIYRNPPSAAGLPYRSYSAYLRERYGVRVHRVAVDAGFSCPNRIRDFRGEGCSFCDASGSRAPYLADLDDIAAQVERGLDFGRLRYGAEAFILYFQAFSNTFAPVRVLRGLYDAGLRCHPFREFVVSTRPDCIDEEGADLLASYRTETRDVWVELGLQTAKDETLRRIGRGHDFAAFRRGFGLLRNRGLGIAVHLVLGLPGETRDDIRRTADAVAEHSPDGIKLHNLHIPFACPLYREFLGGEVTVAGPEMHLEYVVDVLRRMPPQTVVMRFLCDSPPGRIAAPRRFVAKQRFHEMVASALARRGLRQGDLYRASAVSKISR